MVVGYYYYDRGALYMNAAKTLDTSGTVVLDENIYFVYIVYIAIKAMSTRKFDTASINTWPSRTQNYANVTRKPEFEREYKGKVSPRRRRLYNKKTAEQMHVSHVKKNRYYHKNLKNVNNHSDQPPSWFTPYPKEHRPKLYLHRKPPVETKNKKTRSPVKPKVTYLVRPIEYEKIVAELLELLDTLKQQRADMRGLYHNVHQAMKLSKYIKDSPHEDIQRQTLQYKELEKKLLYVLSKLNKHIDFVRNKYYEAVQEARRSRALLNIVRREERQGLVKPKILSVQKPTYNKRQERQNDLNKLLLQIKYDSGEIDGAWIDEIKNSPQMIKIMKDFSKSRPHQMISYIMKSERQEFKKSASAISKTKKKSTIGKDGKPKAFFPTKARPNTPVARSY
jgi:hypothetical protein